MKIDLKCPKCGQIPLSCHFGGEEKLVTFESVDKKRGDVTPFMKAYCTNCQEAFKNYRPITLSEYEKIKKQNLYQKCKAPREYTCSCERDFLAAFIMENWTDKPRNVHRYGNEVNPAFPIKYDCERKWAGISALGVHDVYYFLFCPFCGKSTREMRE